MQKFFLMAFIVNCHLVSAQLTKPKGAVEIRAMFNVSNLKETNGSISQTYSSIIRPNIGIIGHVPINRKCWVTPGVFYNGLGCTESNVNLLLNYVSIPVLFKYVPGKNGVVEIFAGPQFSLLIDAKGKNSQSGGASADIKTYFGNTDISGVAGVSVVPAKKSPLVLIAQYMVGLTNIADKNLTSSQPGTKSTVKNNAFSFGVGYRF